jgi:hypothetical protein
LTIGNIRQREKEFPMSATKFDIGPGALTDNGSGGPAFILSNPDFVAVQTYVESALSLPKTKVEFKTYLGAGAPADMSDFAPLIDVYRSMFDASTKWSDKTFPDTVKLASEVYDYGQNKAPVYYRPILPLAEILTNDPGNAAAKAKLKAILDNLQRTAKGIAHRAQLSADKVKAYAEVSQADQGRLNDLFARYKKQYGETSADVKRLTDDIATQRLVLQAANDEYNHNVIVAATTPTYVWIFPAGMIAAAVVAGVYGKRATDALDRSRAAQARIQALDVRLIAHANVMDSLHLSKFSITNISKRLAKALPVIQKIHGVWGGIADDLGAIVKLIDDDIRNALPIIMDLGVEQAIRSWAAVARAADAYRVNAFVSIAPADSMEAWRLDRMHPVPAMASLSVVA